MGQINQTVKNEQVQYSGMPLTQETCFNQRSASNFHSPMVSHDVWAFGLSQRSDL